MYCLNPYIMISVSTRYGSKDRKKPFFCGYEEPRQSRRNDKSRLSDFFCKKDTIQFYEVSIMTSMVRLSVSLAVLSLLFSNNSDWLALAKQHDNSSNKAASSKRHPLIPAAFWSKVNGGSTNHVVLTEDEKPTESLEVNIPLSQSPTLLKSRDAPLMRDISMLSDILLDLVQQEDPKVHDLYEEFLQYGKER